MKLIKSILNFPFKLLKWIGNHIIALLLPFIFCCLCSLSWWFITANPQAILLPFSQFLNAEIRQEFVDTGAIAPDSPANSPTSPEDQADSPQVANYSFDKDKLILTESEFMSMLTQPSQVHGVKFTDSDIQLLLNTNTASDPFFIAIHLESVQGRLEISRVRTGRFDLPEATVSGLSKQAEQLANTFNLDSAAAIMEELLVLGDIQVLGAEVREDELELRIFTEND